MRSPALHRACPLFASILLPIVTEARDRTPCRHGMMETSSGFVDLTSFSSLTLTAVNAGQEAIHSLNA